MGYEIERQLSVMANCQQVNGAFDSRVQQKVVRQNVFPQGLGIGSQHSELGA